MQDIYLTGNPQITFFKVVYRRHTNYAMESIEQTFNGAANWGKKVTCTVSRNGDLIHRVYLRVVLPDVDVPQNKGFRWLNWLGHILVKTVEVEIGGQRIDKHYGDWLHIWNELTQTAGHQLGYANMVGNVPSLVSPLVNTDSSPKTVKGQVLYIPLQFWFNRNPGLALPLIALQYHEVKINLEFNDLKNCYWAAPAPSGVVGTTDLSQVVPGELSASLYVDYIYLDTDERRRFAQVSHEYLIEQLQFTGDESTSNVNTKVKLNFNHPCKELIWVVQPDSHLEDGSSLPYGKQWFNYTDGVDPTFTSSSAYTLEDAYGGGASVVQPDGADNLAGGMPGVAAGGANRVFVPVSFEGGDNPVARAKIQLNGHDRFAEMDGRYFNLVQPFQHHENVPSRGINVYSFGLKPEEHQPSGTCNMSRIDSATLNLTLTSATVNSRSAKVRVYAVNYNVLRIMSGMGGLKSTLMKFLKFLFVQGLKAMSQSKWLGKLIC
jgi:Large eukaryotic DNA virus major capsid protein/Major capsid protein N-terminus